MSKEQDEDETCCSICSLPDNLINTNCMHEFHLNCLLSWNARNCKINVDTTCPVCRAVLLKAEPVTGRIIATGHQPAGHENLTNDLQNFLGVILTNQLTTLNSETNNNKMLRIIANNKLAELHAWILTTPSIVNLQMEQGMSPLHHCIFNRKFHLMDVLISKGASVRKQNAFGMTPLMLAILIDNTNCVRKILNKRCDIDTTDGNGESALFYAVKTHDTTVVNMLCRLNADVNIANKMGETIFHLLAEGTFTRNMTSILKRCNPSCLNFRDSTGDTALHVAVENQNLAFLRKYKSLLDPQLRLVTNHHGELAEELLEEVDDYQPIRDFFSSWQLAVGTVEITMEAAGSEHNIDEDVTVPI